MNVSKLKHEKKNFDDNNAALALTTFVRPVDEALFQNYVNQCPPGEFLNMAQSGELLKMFLAAGHDLIGHEFQIDAIDPQKYMNNDEINNFEINHYMYKEGLNHIPIKYH